MRLCSVRVSWPRVHPLPQPQSCDTHLVKRSVVRCAVLSQGGAQHEHKFVVVLGRRPGNEPPARHGTGGARAACVPSADKCPRSRPETCRFPTCRHDTECATLQRSATPLSSCAALKGQRARAACLYRTSCRPDRPRSRACGPRTAPPSPWLRLKAGESRNWQRSAMGGVQT